MTRRSKRKKKPSSAPGDIDWGLDDLDFGLDPPKQADTNKEPQNKSLLFGFSDITKDIADTISDTKKEAQSMAVDISRIKTDLKPVGSFLKKRLQRKDGTSRQPV